MVLSSYDKHNILTTYNFIILILNSFFFYIIIWQFVYNSEYELNAVRNVLLQYIILYSYLFSLIRIPMDGKSIYFISE